MFSIAFLMITINNWICFKCWGNVDKLWVNRDFWIINKKFRSSLFKGSWVWATPKKSCFFANFQAQTATLFVCWSKVWQNRRQPLKSIIYKNKEECLFVLLSHYKAFAIVLKPPNIKLFGYRNFALSKVFVGFAHTHNLWKRLTKLFCPSRKHRQNLKPFTPDRY